LNVPETEGVPEMVIVLAAQVAVTPVGNPVADPIPVARVVVWEMLGIAVFIQTVGVVEGADAVLFGFTINPPERVEVTLGPHPLILETTT
jgi:hypothetical protein